MRELVRMLSFPETIYKGSMQNFWVEGDDIDSDRVG